MQIVVPTVAGAIVLVSACFVLVYRCRVAVFAKFNVHPFDVDECDGEDMAFDAFVSCAWPDDDLAQQVLYTLLLSNFSLNLETKTLSRDQNRDVGTSVWRLWRPRSRPLDPVYKISYNNLMIMLR